MNEAEARPEIKRILDAHEGEGNPITAGDIAKALGWNGKYDDRKVRLIIEAMLWEADLAVLATTKDPPGYFKPNTWAEWQEYEQALKARIKGICERKAQVKKNIYNLFHGMKKVKLF